MKIFSHLFHPMSQLGRSTEITLKMMFASALGRIEVGMLSSNLLNLMTLSSCAMRAQITQVLSTPPQR